MSRLRIRFGPKTGQPTHIPVEVIASNSARVWEGVMDIKGELAVEVGAGTYLVQARLPNGNVLRAQEQVGSSDDASVLLQPVVDSPDGQVPWANYSQSNAARRSVQWTPESFGESQRVSLTIWKCEYSGWRLVGEPQIPSEVTVSPFHIEQLSLRLNSGPAWLQISTLHQSMVLALPSWERTTLALEISLDENRGLIAAVGGFRRCADAMLKYLSIADYGSARTLGPAMTQIAEDSLQAKLADPITATIGGYYLLKVGAIGQLHDWSFNLARWFPTIPDGCVIAGWHALRKSPPDVKLAASFFEEAQQRGLPFFTIGVQMLLNGMLALRSNAEARQNEQALDWVARYSCSITQPSGVTCFEARDPSQPGLKAR